MILGHLVPAGTGFKSHQEAEVRIRPEALAEIGPGGHGRYPRDEAPPPAPRRQGRLSGIPTHRRKRTRPAVPLEPRGGGPSVSG